MVNIWPQLSVRRGRAAVEFYNVFLAHRVDLSGTGRHRSVEHGLRVVNDQQHAHRSSADRLRAEVAVRRRLVGHPERCVAHG
jgi:hypothetical protein